MTDRECVEFLQWALPRMRMRWPGFRKVRGQVCKRIGRRIAALDLPSVAGYQAYIDANTNEWKTLASLCRVTISRFYRDRGVFDHIGNRVLPRLARSAEADLRCWSVGCASGEEAYTIEILWQLRARSTKSGRTLQVLGTDSDAVMLDRARRAAYPASALKDLPADLMTRAFERTDDEFLVKTQFKENVHFEKQDVRESMPAGPFDFILCRNLVFTYFDESLQQDILHELLARLTTGGLLVTGVHESLPTRDVGLIAEVPGIYVRTRM